MTAKEKFFQAIEQLGAKRVENLFGTPSWSCLADGNVHIFNQPDGDEHFDHFTISVEYATWSVHVLKTVIWATANDGVSHPHKPDEELLELILKFIEEYADCTEEERVKVMFYLWDIGAFDIPREMGESWLEHESYEDDVDYESMLRLDDETHSIICQIQGLFDWLDDHNEPGDRIIVTLANDVICQVVGKAE